VFEKILQHGNGEVLITKVVDYVRGTTSSIQSRLDDSDTHRSLCLLYSSGTDTSNRIPTNHCSVKNISYVTAALKPENFLNICYELRFYLTESTPRLELQIVTA
jgi:hypothetical protein